MQDVKTQLTVTNGRGSLHRLATVLARRCKRRTVVVGRDSSALAGKLDNLGVDILVWADTEDRTNFRFIREGDNRVETVICMDFLEHLDTDEEKVTLERIWQSLGDRGQLITCVANTDAGISPASSRSRRQLRDLMKRFGRTKLLSSQPFKWLVAVNKKGISITRDTLSRLEIVAKLCHGSVIELGCGRGHLTAAISRRGLAVKGLELNAKKVAEAQAFYSDICFEQGDILSIPPGATQYDSVVISEVIEHVTPDLGRKILDTGWHLVAPNGRFVVSVPYEDLIPHRNHLTEFSLNSLKQTLEVYGEPKVVTEQPLKWLLMYVDKAS